MAGTPPFWSCQRHELRGELQGTEPCTVKSLFDIYGSVAPKAAQSSLKMLRKDNEVKLEDEILKSL